MFIALLLVCAMVIVISYFKSGKLIRSLFLSVFYGLASLFAVNFIGGFTGLHLSVNLFSLLISCVSGMPGVIFLVVSDLIANLI